MDVFVTVERRIVANALSGTFYQLQQLSKIKLRPVHVNVADGWITWDGELELSDFDTSGFRIGPLTVSVRHILSQASRADFKGRIILSSQSGVGAERVSGRKTYPYPFASSPIRFLQHEIFESYRTRQIYL